MPAPFQQSAFTLPKMDCSSEENLVRMALGGKEGIQSLRFDLPARELTVLHTRSVDQVAALLQPLNLGASLLSTAAAPAGQITGADESSGDREESRTLKILLGINAAMFVFELVLGVVAQSTGLVADSLDMFADAAVYGLALFAVGRAPSLKAKAAHVAGWLQALLAFGVLGEVIRRVLFGSDPESALMMAVGFVALLANVTCLLLVSKHRGRGAHMKASYIFSANDVIANAGVIVAGLLVAWTGSRVPDLIIGTIIAVVVLNGARRILKLK